MGRKEECGGLFDCLQERIGKEPNALKSLLCCRNDLIRRKQEAVCAGVPQLKRETKETSLRNISTIQFSTQYIAIKPVVGNLNNVS